MSRLVMPRPVILAQPLSLDSQGPAQLNRLIAHVRSDSLRRFLLQVLADIRLRQRLMLYREPPGPLALMGCAASLARANTQIAWHERETLYTATLVARLPSLVRHSLDATPSPAAARWPELSQSLDAAVRCALNQLETLDPPRGALVRHALGLGVGEDWQIQQAWHGAQLQAVVSLAWAQAQAILCPGVLPRWVGLPQVDTARRV